MVRGTWTSVVLVSAAGAAVCFALLGYLSLNPAVRSGSQSEQTSSSSNPVVQQHYAELRAKVVDRLVSFTERALTPVDAIALQTVADDLMQWQVPAEERGAHLALVVAVRRLADSIALPAASSSAGTKSPQTTLLQAQLRTLLGVAVPAVPAAAAIKLEP